MSCEVPVHEEYDLYGDGIDDGDDNPTPTNNTWLPLALNNQWNYNVTDQTGTNAQNLIVSSTTQFQGATYFVLNSNVHYGTETIDSETYMRRDSNGKFTMVAILDDESVGLVADPVISHPLKDGMSVGNTWNETVQYNYTEPVQISFSSQYTYKYEEHFNTLVVNGVTFNDVCKIKTTVTNTGQPAQSTYTYYAKNVGMIKAEGENLGSQSTSTITSYHLN